ncbi:MULTISPECIES: glycerol-3-phosphate 1-O-acyltransferase PlsY [Brevibacillus]|jgi:glycerol-3-phosphate acyltransferase PlsY|uniref:Glycerol-3-phosphate acyltransferase n=1 Tax=Brevibacillus parabrevis TaxID=54914 RepID=A0A4Y3PE37_BREPA|nr:MULTISPECIES: glycerol-3-phosphate 1-O-acyltransferase PlsY [Brevibacillus]TGV17911.1 glycerol-3-phosphate 1-O-acyltransferase [Mesorhizobium sp. M00.F.Ca.ET.186.01.1.1]KZE55449.1 acyl-phosphate glycerol 3-phosphate acyltransferase [Brevibacillus parabrevis]MBU8712138.1 glycerol-3-phosphate 1-O-acyltransferase PlsY [Brevibacillus parabrevis]MDH6349206.1 glycerol-3-phosphate acyltransferase PlsY [Brevibacillus sp. 1238]MDR5001220.1 glycerol-3-phosphate 1-O-acyltransferase PlsY [Brevibacillus
MVLLAWVLSYLIGSISFSYLIAKKVAGIDIRSHGSGNAGATNTLRVLGKGPGIAVLILDALKGLAAMGITHLMTGDAAAYAVAGLFVIAGHNWPIYFGFRGGKGVATTLGVVLGFSPLAFLIAAVLAVLVIAITRYVSLGSLVLVTVIPISLYLLDKPISFVWTSLVIAVFAYVRHYNNIQNLIAGTERKLGDKSNRKLG